jgi:hypothetical protein
MQEVSADDAQRHGVSVDDDVTIQPAESKPTAAAAAAATTPHEKAQNKQAGTDLGIRDDNQQVRALFVQLFLSRLDFLFFNTIYLIIHHFLIFK